jgi:hypothetical protein
MITPQVAAPVFSPVAGNYVGNQTITLGSTTPGTTLIYTLDGSTPTSNGNGIAVHGSTYSGPFPISKTTTINVLGSLAGYADSAIATATFTLTPPNQVAPIVFTPGTNTFTGPQTVAISSATPSTTICYTTNGLLPTTDGNGHCTFGGTLANGGSVTVNSSTLLQAIGTQAGFVDSGIGMAVIIISGVSVPGRPTVIILL